MKIFRKILFIVAVYVLGGFALWLHVMELVAGAAAKGKAKSPQQKISKAVGKEIEKLTRLGRKKIQGFMITRSSNKVWQQVWRYV